MSKLWIHTGPGHYLGCTIIVQAETLEKAAFIVRKELDGMGWSNAAIHLEELVVKEGVVYSDNGDY
jgi:hypothetical protein